MKKGMTVVFCLVVCSQISPVFGQDVPEIIQAIDEKQQKILTLVADFSQKKDTSLSQKPLLSSGVVRFKRPGRFHFTYTKPEAMELAFDGQDLWIYSAGRSQAERYPLARAKKLAQFLDPLMGIFQKTLAQLSEGYTITYQGLEADRLYRFRLQPREGMAQKFLAQADLWIDKASGAILRFVMLEANGDRLNLDFRNLRINPPLADDELAIRIPPSVKIQEQVPP